MANAAYDPETEQQPGQHRASNPDLGPGHNTPSGKSSDPREEGAQHDSSDPREDLLNREQNGDSGSSEGPKGYNPDNIKGREQFTDQNSRYNAGGDQGEKDSMFNARGDQGGRFGKAREGLQNFKGKASKNKILLGAFVGGGGGLVIILILLVLIAGSLKIPNLATHIAEYQFARVLRQSVETQSKITNEKLALDSVSDEAHGRYKTAYENVRKDTWGKLDKYRPGRVIKNMKGDKTLAYIYDDPSITGRQRLKEVRLNGETFEVKQQTYRTRFIPGISGAIDFKNKYDFAKNFAPAQAEALKANNIGPVIRGLSARTLRQELGINLVAWTAGKYAGKSETKARLQVERDAHKAIAQPGTETARAAPIKEGVENASQVLEEDVKDDKSLQDIIDHGGSDPRAEEAIEKAVAPTNFKNVVGFINPLYGTAIAACIIYDGSLTESGPTIDAASASEQRAYYYIATAADQQKRKGNGEAIGAINAKLGDISPSNPEVRASTGTMDTSSSISSQASAGGELSILDVLLGGGVISTITSAPFQAACPALTNIYLGTGGAILLAALLLVPGVGEAETAVDGAVDATASSVTKRLVTNIVAKSANKQAVGRFNAKARFIAKDTLKSGAKVAALTILAKLIVMSKAHAMNNGLEQNAEFANMGDAGGDAHDSALMQRQFYGRPLTTGEAAADLEANNKYLIHSHLNDSAYTRYMAVSNPNSLINRMATLTASTFRASVFSSFINLGGKVLAPVSSVNNLLGAALMPRALAAADVTPTGTFYGHVERGYSPKEMKILHTDFTFRVLENQAQLDESGREDEINDKYGKCFDGSVTIGKMLAEGMIVRDKDGNVDPDKGDCAPNKLSSDSNEFGNMMVFRWRVAHNYDNGLNQLLDEQVVTKNPTAPGAPAEPEADSSVAVSGDAKKLATDILANKDITYIFSARKDVELASEGKPGTNGVPLDIRTLQVVAALGKKHKLVVSAYESYGQGHTAGSDHYTGHAVDIANIDGQIAYKNITDFYSEIATYSEKAVFLQGNCTGAKSAPSGMNRKSGDECNHQHISFN